jgi:hypothetical protein
MTEIIPLRGDMTPQTEVVAVPFLGGQIPCFMHEGEPMVILKPIVEDAMRLSWPRQYAKISADQTACVAFKAIRLPHDDRVRKHMGVSLETFTVWLARLQPSRVADEAREIVLTYQREAARALRNHFFGQRAEVEQRPADGLAVLEGMIAEIRADRERINVLEGRQAVISAKVAAIEGHHDWFTALGFAKLNDYPTDRPYLQRVGTKAGRILRARGDEPVKRQDATYGSINTYPADVLAEAFSAVTR